MSYSTTASSPANDELVALGAAMLARADREGRLTFVNPAWRAGLGRDTTGARLADLAAPADRAAVDTVLRHADRSPPAGGEHGFLHADGAARRWAWRATPSQDGSALLLTATDVTALRAAADDAGAELDALASALSHDVRAPLRAITGFSQILLDDRAEELPPDTRRFLALVRSAGSDLAGLLDGLLAVTSAAREPLQPQDGVDPGQVAAELVETLLRPRQGERDVTWVIGDVPPARADPRMVRRLLDALLDNALTATAPHATARIELGWDADASAYVVRDDGVGFDDARLPAALAIFGRLQAADDAAGPGVGLAVAARLAARHGGRLWARSAPGAGAAFWFTLGG